MFKDSRVDETEEDRARYCGGKAPLVASLTALALIVVVAFVGLVVLDRLQLDAADHARTATIRGALDFTASAVGAGFEEARVLAVRLARGRKYAHAATCLNESAPLRTVYFPFQMTMNSTTQRLFAVYDILLATGVPQIPGQLAYTICGVADNILVYRSNPPRMIQFDTAALPEVIGKYNGPWEGSSWNQSETRYVRHMRSLRKGSGAEETGDWSESDSWVQPLTKRRILYLTVTVPTAYNGPTEEPSAAVSIDVLGDGLEPLLRRVKLDHTRIALVDPRPSPIKPNLVPKNGVLLANTFESVPAMNDDGASTLRLWPADATPDTTLNQAVIRVADVVPDGLNSLDGIVEIADGPDDTVVGAIGFALPGRLRLVAFVVTPRFVFYGNLNRSRRMSWLVGAACGIVCLIALIAFVLISNNAARRLLQHVMSNSGRDIRLAPKDESKPFAIAFTDIQSSTALWARLPQEMGPALDTHHAVVRRCIGRHGGYEVKTIGDSFMVAFEDPANAVAFSLDVQTELHSACWGADDEVAVDNFSLAYEDHGQRHSAIVLGTPDTPDTPGSPRCFVDPQLWAGLRVRVGVHYGYGEIKFDETSKGYDYYGTVVNTAARVEAVAHGGQVLVTLKVLEAIGAASPQSTLQDTDTTSIGACPLRGLSDPVELVQLLPAKFKGRVFPPPRLHSNLPLDDDLDIDGPAEPSAAHLTPETASVFLEDIVELPGDENERNVCERIWRRHGASAIALEKFVLCCSAVHAVMASLSNAQRKTALRMMAKKWWVPHSTESGQPVPEAVLVAFMMARAAPQLPTSSSHAQEFSPATLKSPPSAVPNVIDFAAGTAKPSPSSSPALIGTAHSGNSAPSPLPVSPEPPVKPPPPLTSLQRRGPTALSESLPPAQPSCPLPLLTDNDNGYVASSSLADLAATALPLTNSSSLASAERRDHRLPRIPQVSFLGEEVTANTESSSDDAPHGLDASIGLPPEQDSSTPFGFSF